MPRITSYNVCYTKLLRLDALGITYPQYLVLMVLWEKENISVIEIGEKLILNTNTITPLLKRMENIGLITRTQAKTDQRKVLIALTEKGRSMQDEAAQIPFNLIKKMNVEITPDSVENMESLKNQLNELIKLLKHVEI